MLPFLVLLVIGVEYVSLPATPQTCTAEHFARMRERYRAEDLVRTDLGGAVVCEDRDLLFEEAPEAYKRIERVVGDLVDARVCEIVATLRPVVTYKTRRH